MSTETKASKLLEKAQESIEKESADTLSEGKSTVGWLTVTRLGAKDKTKFSSIEKSMKNFLATGVKFDNKVNKVTIKDTDIDNPKGYTLILKVLHDGPSLKPVWQDKASYDISYYKEKPKIHENNSSLIRDVIETKASKLLEKAQEVLTEGSVEETSESVDRRIKTLVQWITSGAKQSAILDLAKKLEKELFN